MTTFANEIKKVGARPIVIAHMEPKQRIMSGWSVVSGTKYKVSTDYFVIDCSENGASLTEAASSSVGANEWFFDSSTKELYIDVGENPADTFIHFTYRLFFSNIPIDLPFDMASGKEVHYTGLIDSTSDFKDEINPDDLVGIALSGTGSLKFYNDGTWQGIYSKLFWETSLVKIYIGFTNIAVSEYQLVYRGFIDSKSYDPDSVSFTLKDFIEKLRSEVPLSLFTDADGDITDQGKAKRRIYGKAKVLGISLDKIKDGYNLTGTFTKTGDAVITGSGSSLLSEASPEDTIIYTNSIGDEVEFSIQSVDSDTQMTLSEDIDVFADGSTIQLKPERANPVRNRSFFICDHQMREPTTTVITGSSFLSFTVADSTDFEAGDKIKVNGQLTTIKTVSENNVILLLTALNFVPQAGHSVIKQPIANVWFGSRLLVIDRDYTITNSDPSKITIDSSAEFNITPPQPVTDGATSALTFTNASREVTGNIAFKDFFRPWDYVRSNDVTHTTWYQILEVREDKLILRTAYAGSNRTNDGERKNVNYIEDDSRILIEANGITKNDIKTGEWVKTAADVAEHLITEQGLAINTASFTTASSDAPYLVSLTVPEFGQSGREAVREVLDRINQTVLGSLYENSSREITFSILSPRKGTIDTIYRDDDLINYKINSTGKNIAKSVTARYRHEEANIFSGEEDSLVYERTNTFIDYISDIQREEQIDLYVWNTADAETLAQRISLLRENANTVLEFDSNSLFLNKSLNEFVYVELRNMFERFGTDADKNFIGIINMIKKRNGESSIEVTDLGGMYNKIATFADSSAPSYSSTSGTNRANDGYYTDSNGIINSSRNFRMNLYG